MPYSITKNGESLDTSLYIIDENNKTFSSKEEDLTLDFSGEFGWTFNIGDSCTFNTRENCTFSTGSHCTFNTGRDCTFNTEWNCTFSTGRNCTFNTKESCTFLCILEKQEVISQILPILPSTFRIYKEDKILYKVSDDTWVEEDKYRLLVNI